MKTSKHEGLVHTAESWAQYEEMMEKERLHQERKQQMAASGVVRKSRRKASTKAQTAKYDHGS
jgi:hypothetical protein